MSCKRYRKRPVVIEAFRLGHDELPSAEENWWEGRVPWWEPGDPDGSLRIPTLEGVHLASQGDWIIKGVKGEVYPCRDDIFALTYEEVSG